MGRTVTVLYSDGARRLHNVGSRSQFDLHHNTTTTTTSAYSYNPHHVHHPYIHHQYNSHLQHRSSPAVIRTPTYEPAAGVRNYGGLGRRETDAKLTKKGRESRDSLWLECGNEPVRYEPSPLQYNKEDSGKQSCDGDEEKFSPLRYVDDSPDQCGGDSYELGYFGGSSTQSTNHDSASVQSSTSLHHRKKECNTEVESLEDNPSVLTLHE